MKRALLIAMALLAPSLSNAAILSWNYSGACFFGCTGDITGTVTGDPASVSDPALLSGPEVTAWNFLSNLGSVSGGPGTAIGDVYLPLGIGTMTFDSDGAGGKFAFAAGAFGGFFVSGDFVSGTGGTAKSVGSFVAVPEPATLALLGLGLAGLGLVRRKRAA